MRRKIVWAGRAFFVEARDARARRGGGTCRLNGRKADWLSNRNKIKKEAGEKRKEKKRQGGRWSVDRK